MDCGHGSGKNTKIGLNRDLYQFERNKNKTKKKSCRPTDSQFLSYVRYFSLWSKPIDKAVFNNMQKRLPQYKINKTKNKLLEVHLTNIGVYVCVCVCVCGGG